jgi:hypothetical protein
MIQLLHRLGGRVWTLVSQLTLLPDSAERQRQELNLQVALGGVFFIRRNNFN